MTSITNLKNEQKRKFDHVVCIMSTVLPVIRNALIRNKSLFSKKFTGY